MKRILGLRKTLGTLLGALVVACLGAILSPQVVFADASWSRTMTYTAQTEGYDSPSLTITANVNDDGIIMSGLTISAGNGFATDTWCAVEGTYNGPVPTVTTDNSSNAGSISIQTLKNPNRTEVENCATDWSEDGQEELNNASTVNFTFGETSFEDLTNQVFGKYVASYTYTDKNARTSYTVTINDCNDPTVQYVSGPRNCYEGEFAATDGEVNTATGGGYTVDNSWFTFSIGRDASVYRLDCAADASMSGCGANSYTSDSHDATISYNKTVQSMEEVIAAADTATEIDPTTGETTTEGEGEDEEEADPCYSNSGALGWILCPIVSGASDALTGVYETVVEGFLQINPELINSNSPDSGAYGAWNIFRNLANVILIIIMLLVVLSQLTGYGISNYGIKKMLPRLVVLAILINLSYVACQLLVDVSNILGSSLNAFLNNIASGLHTSGSSTGGSALDILTTILGVGGAVLIAAGAAYIGGWTLIIPIVLIVVAGLLAVLFMYLLLGIRQALVVLMVALAPVIIVLYVLPNTQNIAKRGLNLFMGLLMVYPLAGLLMGGCHLASAILLSTTSGTVTDAYTWMIQLIGIALLVIPFFLLPWLVKSTFAAADSVLGKLTNKGQALKGNLQGRARGGLEKGGLGQRAEQQRQQRAQSRTLRMRSGANKRLSKARKNYDAAQAAYGANPNAFTRRRADRAGAALVAAGGQVDAAEKQLNDAANAAVMQAYGDSSNDQIVEVMQGSLNSGYANTDMGGRQFAAMATMLVGRGGKGVESLEKLMGETAFGEENAKNNKAWHQAMTPEVVKQMKDKSVLGGAMTSQIAKTAAPVRNEQPKAIQGLSAQDQLEEIQGASVSTLAAQSTQAFANTVNRFSEKQIKDLHADSRSMSQLSAGNRDMVNARYAEIMNQEGSTDAADAAGSADSNTATSSAARGDAAASASVNLDDVSRETLIVPHGVQGENVAHASQADMEAMARKLRDEQDHRRGRRR